jgi:hypothetical protein
MESLDLLFERVNDVGIQQQYMKVQVEKTAQTVAQQTAEQQRLAHQMAETGRAVVKLTLEKVRAEEISPSDSVEESDGSSVLKHFPTSKHTKSKDNTQRSKASLPKSHIPKVFCPKFTGESPAIWKDKCINYFLLVDLDSQHWVRMAAVHFEVAATQWLQVYKKRVRNPSSVEFVLAVEEKFAKDDYRKAMTELLELRQTQSVEEYYKCF